MHPEFPGTEMKQDLQSTGRKQTQSENNNRIKVELLEIHGRLRTSAPPLPPSALVDPVEENMHSKSISIISNPLNQIASNHNPK